MCQQLLHAGEAAELFEVLDGGEHQCQLARVVRLQRAAGLDRNEPKISFSPPVAFFLLVPLSLVSAKTGLILWMLLLLGCFSASIWLLWLINGRPDSRFHLFGYLFAPALACLSLIESLKFCRSV